jgi:hypothetical protein
VSDWLEYMSDNGIDIDCEQCTLFVPTNEAIRAAALDQYSPEERRAILLGHMLNRIVYTTTIAQGNLLVTSAGNSLAFGSNSTGPFIVGNKTTAALLRANIPSRSSVIHVGPAALHTDYIVDQRRHPQHPLAPRPCRPGAKLDRDDGYHWSASVSSAARRRFQVWR